MICNHCNKEIPDNSQVCPYCGTKVIQKDSSGIKDLQRYQHGIQNFLDKPVFIGSHIVKCGDLIIIIAALSVILIPFFPVFSTYRWSDRSFTFGSFCHSSDVKEGFMLQIMLFNDVSAAFLLFFRYRKKEMKYSFLSGIVTFIGVMTFDVLSVSLADSSLWWVNGFTIGYPLLWIAGFAILIYGIYGITGLIKKHKYF